MMASTSSMVIEWSEPEVAKYLASNGFEELGQVVTDHGIDGQALLGLDSVSLRELGLVKMGPRKRFLKLVATLKQVQPLERHHPAMTKLHLQDQRIEQLEVKLSELRRYMRALRAFAQKHHSPPSYDLDLPRQDDSSSRRKTGGRSPAYHHRDYSTASSSGSISDASSQGRTITLKRQNNRPSSPVSPPSPITPPLYPRTRHLRQTGLVARKPSLTRRARSPLPPHPGTIVTSDMPTVSSLPVELRRSASTGALGLRPKSKPLPDFPSENVDFSSPDNVVRKSFPVPVQTTSEQTAAFVISQQLARLNDTEAWKRHVLVVRYGVEDQVWERALAYDESPLKVFRGFVKENRKNVEFVIVAATDIVSPLRKGSTEDATSMMREDASPAEIVTASGDTIYEFGLALCGYRAQGSDEISIRAGERLTIQAKAQGRYHVKSLNLPDLQAGWVSATCLLQTTKLINATSLHDALSAPIHESILPPTYSSRVAAMNHVPAHTGWVGELSLMTGDSVKIYKTRQNWSYARKDRTGERGWAPNWILVHADSPLATNVSSTTTTPTGRTLNAPRSLRPGRPGQLFRSATDVRTRTGEHSYNRRPIS